MDIEGASTLKNFIVIEIVDNRNPYPTLLGIEWATNINGMINLKKSKVIFEKKSMRVVVPLDLIEGSRYTKLVRDYDNNDELDYIYKIIAREQD